MTSFRIKSTKNGFKLVEPIDNLQRSHGYLMVLNPHGEVLKFFNVGLSERNAREYLEYVSLSRWEKIKYWLNYKRGSRGF